VSKKQEINPGESCFDTLLPALKRLDQLLERAIVQAQNIYGSEAANDAYRGLYINREEIDRLLHREAGTPMFEINRELLLDGVQPDSKLARLREVYELTTFDLDLILIGLAPEIDLRYQRLFAYLQDDVTRKRPSIDLCLNLLCSSAVEKIEKRDHFTTAAPLIRHGLLQMLPEAQQPDAPFLAYAFKLDDQVVRFLLGQNGLDSRLMWFCQIQIPEVTFADLRMGEDVKQGLRFLAAEAIAQNKPVRFHFQGLLGNSQSQAAAAIANHLTSQLLIANLAQLLKPEVEVEEILKVLFREAQFQNAVLYLDGIERLKVQDQDITYRCLLKQVAVAPGITILCDGQTWVPISGVWIDMISVPFTMPDVVQRRACWQEQLNGLGMSLTEDELLALSERFRLTLDQISGAIAVASSQAKWQVAISLAEAGVSQAVAEPIQIHHLFAAARLVSGQELGSLASKVIPKYTWQDLILPPDPLAQLQEICDQAKHRSLVYGEWGFERKLSLGKGLNVLFTGSSGTGKTMAAQVIAHELQVDLYKIDLSQVVSKYIGETEKNLDRIFRAAQSANAILLFDEADALFGKRTEVKDAHDRYANIEVGYLLQKMEEYEGLAILATNLRHNLDDAFLRRLQFIVEFPFPEEDQRLGIWKVVFPAQAPLDEEIDWGWLAREIKLAGGNIKNIALAAAFYAVSDKSGISQKHVIRAAQREYQKLGRIWS
jgi:hypothetical protein